MKLNTEEQTAIIAVLSYNDSACTKCNFPLEYVFTSAKWDNHATLKNTVKTFPTTGRKADILACKSSEDAVSFPVPKVVQTVVIQCTKSTRPKRDRRNLNT